MVKTQTSIPSTLRIANINLVLIIALARAYHAVISEVESQVSAFGLTLSEFGVLEMLYHQGPQPVQVIAERILVTSGTMTYVIDSLSHKGMVERRRSERDRRVRHVHLTQRGRSLIAEIFPQHEGFINRMLVGLDEDTKKALVWGLASLKDCVFLEKTRAEKTRTRKAGEGLIN